MNLQRAFERFATQKLQRWNPTDQAWEDTGITGSLQVYDRFISDRDFGQKKRIFLIPGTFSLDQEKAVLKVSDVPGVWLIEGSNPDADGVGVYANSMVLREAKHKVKLYKVQGARKRASGVGFIDGTPTLVAETWGDFSRYSSTESRELNQVDYTIGSWYLPRGTPVDLDTIIEDNYNQRFVVREVSTFLDLLMVRTQEREDLNP